MGSTPERLSTPDVTATKLQQQLITQYAKDESGSKNADTVDEENHNPWQTQPAKKRIRESSSSENTPQNKNKSTVHSSTEKSVPKLIHQRIK